jgi:hypothetical protein
MQEGMADTRDMGRIPARTYTWCFRMRVGNIMVWVPASPLAQSWASRAPDNRPDGRRESRRASGNVLSAQRVYYTVNIRRTPMIQTFPGVLDALTLCAPNNAFNKEDFCGFHLNEAGTELTRITNLANIRLPCSQPLVVFTSKYRFRLTD